MSPALFQASLYASLALCGLGLLWRAAAWLRVHIGVDAERTPPGRRMAALVRSAFAALASRRPGEVLRTLFLDALLLRRLYANAKGRWLGHLLIVLGFTLLLLMHGLAALVSAQLFPGYQPTLAPYLFLRDLFGVMVIAGVALLHYGRWRQRSGFGTTRSFANAAFMILLTIVLASGFLLHASKLASPRAFYRMTELYTGSGDPEQAKPLRAFWASEFGLAFGGPDLPPDAGLVEQGRELHHASCLACHAQPASAFASYRIAQALSPVAGLLAKSEADGWLLYLHLFACFIGLASLPFTGLFHVLAGPVSVFVSAVPRNRPAPVPEPVFRRALALDACVRCGICDVRCAVAPLARYMGNKYLLPAHKLVATAALASGQLLDPGREAQARRAADGAFLCTDCGRCTSACPVGLDLADLWAAGRGEFAAAGLPGPAQWVQARSAFAWDEILRQTQGPHAAPGADAAIAPLSSARSSFSRCVQCQTCTNVCPVVAYSADSGRGVDLTPQKVMNLLRLGLRDLALGSRMVWDCATCYQCQQSCPEGIRVADIMCELRGLAVQRLGAVRGAAEHA